MDFADSVLKQVYRIPEGRVATYKGIAASLGDVGLSRAVGNAVARNLDTEKVPCYRVVRSDGFVGGYSKGSALKERKLRADGIGIEKGRIKDLGKVLYEPPRLRVC